MFRYLSVVLGIVFALIVAYSFASDAPTDHLFGFEVKIWTFRLFWTILSLGCFYDFIKKARKEKLENR